MTAPGGEAVLVEPLDDGVVQVTLNRPDRRNALDAGQWERLTAVLRELPDNREVRCLVLTGAGTAFASGGDISRFLEEIAEPDGPHRFRRRIHDCLDAVAQFPAPTIAKVNGPAIGGGTELVMSCDQRIASTSARFGIPAVAFGIIMALPDFARLASIVGVDRARHLTMSGAIIDADEAHRIGLVHELVSSDDLNDAVVSAARRMADVSWPAARWFRDAAAALMVGVPSQEAEALREFETQCLETDDFRRRVQRFLERRGQS